MHLHLKSAQCPPTPNPARREPHRLSRIGLEVLVAWFGRGQAGGPQPCHGRTMPRPRSYVPMFGDTDYDPSCAFEGAVPLEEQLEALGRAAAAGKVWDQGSAHPQRPPHAPGLPRHTRRCSARQPLSQRSRPHVRIAPPQRPRPCLPPGSLTPLQQPLPPGSDPPPRLRRPPPCVPQVRYVGLSNETPWGLLTALHAGEPAALALATSRTHASRPPRLPSHGPPAATRTQAAARRLPPRHPLTLPHSPPSAGPRLTRVVAPHPPQRTAQAARCRAWCRCRTRTASRAAPLTVAAWPRRRTWRAWDCWRTRRWPWGCSRWAAVSVSLTRLRACVGVGVPPHIHGQTRPSAATT
jgi:hypothetical protein